MFPMNKKIEILKDQAITSKNIGFNEARTLFEAGTNHPFYLIAAASEIREHFKGKSVNLCGIVNAKSGLCAENCKFCAQSAHYRTDAPEYPMIGKDVILEKAKQAKAGGAHMFGIITSGTSVEDEREWNEIYDAIHGIADLGLKPCVSLGMLDRERAGKLKEAGLYRYHHNLETARTFFSNICTTHAYQQDIDTVLAAQGAGLSTCSGGIIGMGETMDQRIELAMTLKELKVDSVPMNILNPRPGTPLMDTAQLSPMELLITIAIYRFILPDKDIKLCGGKEHNLRQLLPLGIIAGCNSLMTGDYLTTPGRDPASDIEMIKDLGLEAILE
ncbi:MAG: biotin synthase BioB [Syntrophus sp. (in: bacteria)]|nr:biotin synthase BioB [Syntrophus sp. (in: bacteria)]